jgi:hypothetical protein
MKNFKLFFKGFYKGMKIYGANVTSVTNFILLLPVYFIGVGITSIIAKITGKHFLNLKKSNKKTYWVNKENKKIDIEEYYKQY